MEQGEGMPKGQRLGHDPHYLHFVFCGCEEMSVVTAFAYFTDLYVSAKANALNRSESI
jgi:hypothetical protein